MKATLLFLLLAACSKTTGTGTLGTIDDVRSLSPKIKFPADGALKQNSFDITEHGAKVKLNWWTYDAPDGGKYIASYGWEVVEDKKGTTLAPKGHLNPENAGTEQAPVMRLGVSLGWTEGSSSGDETFFIVGDGTHK